MTPELLALAIEYGWGCKTCDGTGERTPYYRTKRLCPDCHGKHITEADRAEFEQRVAEVVRSYDAMAPADNRDALTNLQRSDTGEVASG